MVGWTRRNSERDREWSRAEKSFQDWYAKATPEQREQRRQQLAARLQAEDKAVDRLIRWVFVAVLLALFAGLVILAGVRERELNIPRKSAGVVVDSLVTPT
jgi:hypothetical protein